MHPITKRKLYCSNESPIVKTEAEQSFCYAPKEESGCILSKRFSGRLLLRQWRRRKKERNIHNSGCICRFALEFCNYKKERTETLYQSFSPFMAEKPGFEPGRRLSHPTPLAGEPLRPLGYFSITRFTGKMAEREGFEPPVPFSITGFQDQRHQPLGHPSAIATDGLAGSTCLL